MSAKSFASYLNSIISNFDDTERPAAARRLGKAIRLADTEIRRVERDANIPHRGDMLWDGEILKFLRIERDKDGH